MNEPAAAALHTSNVTAGLDSLLEPFGYRQFERAAKLGDLVIFTWRRNSEWKSNEVQLGLERRMPTDMVVNFSVYIPDIERNAERILDGRTVEYLVGRSKPYYLPNFFGRVVSRSSSRYAKRICADTAKALQWFELFDSPEKCLVQLRAGETNGAGAPGGGPHPWFETYFAKLIDSAPPIAEDT